MRVPEPLAVRLVRRPAWRVDGSGARAHRRRRAGTHTYQEWAGFWPTMPADDPFARFINEVPKYVASRTLGTHDLTWQNSRLIEEDLTASVARLAQGQGGTSPSTRASRWRASSSTPGSS